MKKIITVCTIVLAANYCAFAQVRGNSYYNDTQVQASRRTTEAISFNDTELTVEIYGILNALPDSYTAIFSIVQVADSAAATEQLMNTRINSFIHGLKQLGIMENSIAVDIISFVPKYDFEVQNKIYSKTFNEVPAGFELQKNIFVTYTKSSMLNAILAKAAAVEIYDLVKVEYFVNDIDKKSDMLRDRCLLSLKAKIKSCELLGFRLDTLRKAFSENNTSVYPGNRYASYQAFSRPSMEAVKKKTLLGNSSKLNEQVKTNTAYYNKVEYDGYDVVINPAVTEPVVQFTYNVTMKYFLKEPEKQKDNYFMVTPAGDIKPIRMH
jgi:uncharacterized protein YggE